MFVETLRAGATEGVAASPPRHTHTPPHPLKKRERSVGLDSPGTGKKSRRKSGGGPVITAGLAGLPAGGAPRGALVCCEAIVGTSSSGPVA